MDKILAGIETRLIHAGKPEPPIEGAVITPIFQSSTFEYAGQKSYHDLRYIRLSNTPNHTGLARKLAAIEGADAALVTASGMAAIATTLLTVLDGGDHLLCQRCVYGGTHGLVTTELPRLGIETTFIDPGQPATWKAQLRSNTRAIYVETISNPLLEVGDLRAVAEFARAHGLISIIDNTFATPINFRPSEVGFDLSLHSCTKYLNGHSDIVAGAVIGGRDLVDRVTHSANHLGGALDPHACFLLDRGLKTLAVRVRHQNESALRIARFLERHPRISAVYYPGLESHNDHLRARELLEGFGGVLSFEVEGGVQAAETFIGALTLPVSAPSLGGVESLVTRPVTTSHSAMTPAQLAEAGIADGLVRLSIGLEATEDLIADLQRALSI